METLAVRGARSRREASTSCTSSWCTSTPRDARLVAEEMGGWAGPRLVSRPTGFLAPAWVEGVLPDLPARELAVAGQLQLRRAATIGPCLDFALGTELARFFARWHITDLGHTRLTDFAAARFACSASHVD